MKKLDIDVTQVMYRTDELEFDNDAVVTADTDLKREFELQGYPLDELLQLCAMTYDQLGNAAMAAECRAWSSSELIIQ